MITGSYCFILFFFILNLFIVDGASIYSRRNSIVHEVSSEDFSDLEHLVRATVLKANPGNALPLRTVSWTESGDVLSFTEIVDTFGYTAIKEFVPSPETNVDELILQFISWGSNLIYKTRITNYDECIYINENLDFKYAPLALYMKPLRGTDTAESLKSLTVTIGHLLYKWKFAPKLSQERYLNRLPTDEEIYEALDEDRKSETPKILLSDYYVIKSLLKGDHVLLTHPYWGSRATGIYISNGVRRDITHPNFLEYLDALKYGFRVYSSTPGLDTLHGVFFIDENTLEMTSRMFYNDHIFVSFISRIREYRAPSPETYLEYNGLVPVPFVQINYNTMAKKFYYDPRNRTFANGITNIRYSLPLINYGGVSIFSEALKDIFSIKKTFEMDLSPASRNVASATDGTYLYHPDTFINSYDIFSKKLNTRYLGMIYLSLRDIIVTSYWEISTYLSAREIDSIDDIFVVRILPQLISNPVELDFVRTLFQYDFGFIDDGNIILNHPFLLKREDNFITNERSPSKNYIFDQLLNFDYELTEDLENVLPFEDLESAVELTMFIKNNMEKYGIANITFVSIPFTSLPSTFSHFNALPGDYNLIVPSIKLTFNDGHFTDPLQILNDANLNNFQSYGLYKQLLG